MDAPAPAQGGLDQGIPRQRQARDNPTMKNLDFYCNPVFSSCKESLRQLVRRAGRCAAGLFGRAGNAREWVGVGECKRWHLDADRRATTCFSALGKGAMPRHC